MSTEAAQEKAWQYYNCGCGWPSIALQKLTDAVQQLANRHDIVKVVNSFEFLDILLFPASIGFAHR